jgi:O-antigen ligase
MKNLQDNLYSITFLFLILFIILIVAGPQNNIEYLDTRELNLGEIFGYSALVFYVLSSLSNKRPLIVFDRETLLLFIFLFLAIVSFPFSPWSDESLNSLISFVPTVVIFILLAHVINSVQRVKKLMFVYIICNICVAYVAINNYLEGNYIAGGNRILGAHSGLAGGPNEVARSVALMIPFALSFYLINKSRLKKFFYLFSIMIAILTIMCTYSRAGLLMLIVVFGLFFLKRFKQKGLRIIVPVVFLSIFIPSVIPDDFSKRLSTSFDFERDGSARERRALQNMTFKVLLENPVIGVGIGMNELALRRMGLDNVVHNIYLRIGSEIGIPALIIFLILSYRLVKNMHAIQAKFKEDKEHQEIFYIAMAIEICLISYFFNGLFSPAAYKLTFYYFAGMAIALNRIAVKYNKDTTTF